MNYVDEPTVDEVPTDVAVKRVYMVLLMRAGSTTGDEWEKYSSAAKALGTALPEPINEWLNDMGMKPLQSNETND